MDKIALDIQLLGGFDLHREGEPVPRLPSRKGQWLLALLALRQGQEVSRDWLAAALWADSERAKGLRNLRQLLADEVRPVLGPAACHLRSPVAQTLCLDQEGVTIDVVAFDAALAKGTMAGLESAIALYRGPLLEGCPEEWILPERTVREQAYLAALEALAGRAAEQGDPAGAVRYLRLLLTTDPYREAAYIALMRAFAESGDYAAVTRTYRDLRLLLHRELHVRPAPETETLYRQLLNQAQPSVLRNPARIERPALSPRRLPIPLTSLIGREAEVATVVARLSTHRLITLTGAGGVGKTRLAIAAGHRLANAYPDGVWFVELASLTDPMHVVQTVATALGLEEKVPQRMPEALVERLAGRTLLLILDNCEHLLSVCAALVEILLRSSTGLRVLCTSRQPLGASGELVYRIPSLALPPALAAIPLPEGSAQTAAGRTPSELLGYGAVQLFVERALLTHPTFRITPHHIDALTTICRQLDGIPLALEMAAARVRSLSLEEIACRLEDRFGFLVGGRTVEPRQQTLRSLLDWSDALLTPQERVVMRRLSVFPGGWEVEAAEAVCADISTVAETSGE